MGLWKYCPNGHSFRCNAWLVIVPWYRASWKLNLGDCLCVSLLMLFWMWCIWTTSWTTSDVLLVYYFWCWISRVFSWVGSVSDVLRFCFLMWGWCTSFLTLLQNFLCWSNRFSMGGKNEVLLASILNHTLGNGSQAKVSLGKILEYFHRLLHTLRYPYRFLLHHRMWFFHSHRKL